MPSIEYQNSYANHIGTTGKLAISAFLFSAFVIWGQITHNDCLKHTQQKLLTIIPRGPRWVQITFSPRSGEWKVLYSVVFSSTWWKCPCGNKSWRAEGRTTAWLGWGSDRRSGSVLGQGRTLMLSHRVWRLVIVLPDCDLQTDDTVNPPSASCTLQDTWHLSIIILDWLLLVTVLTLWLNIR